jgi:hypothetical protein
MRRAKIALIEDNPGDVMLIKMALQENGIDYECQPWILPQFRQGLEQVPIAILTSSAAERDKNRAAIQGVPYIEKPSELAAFLSSVANAVRNMLSQG